jgi:hypothetical protein
VKEIKRKYIQRARKQILHDDDNDDDDNDDYVYDSITMTIIILEKHTFCGESKLC